jgi:DNA polymerase-3 subunit delta
LLYILLGQDDFSRRQALEEIKKGMGDQVLLATNTTTLDGQQLTLDQLRTVCETVPFLAERRLVIVSGLLERFEPGSKPRRQRKAAPVFNQQNEYKLLASCIARIPDSTNLVLMDGRIRSSNPLLRELSAQAQVKSFPLLKNTRLRQWIQRRVKEEGGSLSLEAVNLLTRLIGSNLWIMASEINKLVLFSAGRRIEEEDVKGLVSYAQEANVFAMVDAILEFRAGVAEQLLQRLLESGAAPAYLLVMLSRQVQRIVRAKELRNQRQSEAEIQDRLGLTSEFVLRKVLEQAGRYPMRQIIDVYHKLLETDLSIKTGKYGGELALNLLVADLCQRRRR